MELDQGQEYTAKNWVPHAEVDYVKRSLEFARERGVVEKCTFCIKRVRQGLNPACHEVCPTGSRKFGNLLDPDSIIRTIIDTKRIYILKEEVGTDPSFYYFFD